MPLAPKLPGLTRSEVEGSAREGDTSGERTRKEEITGIFARSDIGCGAFTGYQIP